MGKEFLTPFKYIEEFVEKFFKSPYIANWLGISVPQLWDIRDFALQNPFRLNPKFLKILFPENLPDLYEKGLDELIKIAEIPDLVHQYLVHYEGIKDFFRKNIEEPVIELQFQLPFIKNSRFDRNTKKELLNHRRYRYLNTFRRNLTGKILISEEKISEKKQIIYQIKMPDLVDWQRKFNIFILRPEGLDRYWDMSLEKIFVAFK